MSSCTGYVEGKYCLRCPANAICLGGQITTQCKPTQFVVRDGGKATCQDLPENTFAPWPSDAADAGRSLVSLTNEAVISSGCQLLLHSYADNSMRSLPEGNYSTAQLEQILDGQAVDSLRVVGSPGCTASFGGRLWHAGEGSAAAFAPQSGQVLTSMDSARTYCDSIGQQLCSVDAIMKLPALGCTQPGWVTDGMQEAWELTGCPNRWEALSRSANGQKVLRNWYANKDTNPQAVYADMYSLCRRALEGGEDTVDLLAHDLCCAGQDCSPQCMLVSDQLQPHGIGFVSDGTQVGCKTSTLARAWNVQVPEFQPSSTLSAPQIVRGSCRLADNTALRNPGAAATVPQMYSDSLQTAPPCSLLSESQDMCTAQPGCQWTPIDQASCQALVAQHPDLVGFAWEGSTCTVFGDNTGTQAGQQKREGAAGAFCCQQGPELARQSFDTHSLVRQTQCEPGDDWMPVPSQGHHPIDTAHGVCRDALMCAQMTTQDECRDHSQACAWSSIDSLANPCPVSHPYKVKTRIGQDCSLATSASECQFAAGNCVWDADQNTCSDGPKDMQPVTWWCAKQSGTCLGGKDCSTKTTPFECTQWGNENEQCTWSTLEVPGGDNLCQYRGAVLANAENPEELWGRTMVGTQPDEPVLATCDGSAAGKCLSRSSTACGMNPPIPEWNRLKRVAVQGTPLSSTTIQDAELVRAYNTYFNQTSADAPELVTSCQKQCLSMPDCSTVSIVSGGSSEATCTFYSKVPLEQYASNASTMVFDLVSCDMKPNGPQLTTQKHPGFVCRALQPGMGPHCEAFQTEAECTAGSWPHNDAGPGERVCAWRPITRQRTEYTLEGSDHWGAPFTEYEWKKTDTQDSPAESQDACQQACQQQPDCQAWSFYPATQVDQGPNLCRIRTSLYGSDPYNKGFTAYSGGGVLPTSGEIRAAVEQGPLDTGAVIADSAQAQQLCQAQHGSSQLCSPVDLLIGGQGQCQDGWMHGTVPEACFETVNGGQSRLKQGARLYRDESGCIVCQAAGQQCVVPLQSCLKSGVTSWCTMTQGPALVGHVARQPCDQVGAGSGELELYSQATEARGAYCCPPASANALLTQEPVAVRHNKYFADELDREMTALGCDRTEQDLEQIQATCVPVDTALQLDNSTHSCSGFTSAWVRPYTAPPATITHGQACSAPPQLYGDMWVYQPDANPVNVKTSYTCANSDAADKATTTDTNHASEPSPNPGDDLCKAGGKNASLLQQQLSSRDSPDHMPYCCRYHHSQQDYRWQQGECGDASALLPWQSSYLNVGLHATPSLCQNAVTAVGECRATSALQSRDTCSGKQQAECKGEGCSWEQTPTGFLWFEEGPHKHECRALLGQPGSVPVTPPLVGHVKGTLHSGRNMVRQWQNASDPARQDSMRQLLQDRPPVVTKTNTEKTVKTVFLDEAAATAQLFCQGTTAPQQLPQLHYCPPGLSLASDTASSYSTSAYQDKTQYRFPIPTGCTAVTAAELNQLAQTQGREAAMDELRTRCCNAPPAACTAWDEATWFTSTAEAEAYCMGMRASGHSASPVKTPDGLYECADGCPLGTTLTIHDGTLACQESDGSLCSVPLARNLQAYTTPEPRQLVPNVGPSFPATSLPKDAGLAACEATATQTTTAWYYDGTTCHTDAPSLVYQPTTALQPATGYGAQPRTVCDILPEASCRKHADNLGCVWDNQMCTESKPESLLLPWSRTGKPCPALQSFTALPLLPQDLHIQKRGTTEARSCKTWQGEDCPTDTPCSGDCVYSDATPGTWTQELVTGAAPMADAQQANDLCQARGYEGLCTTAQVQSLDAEPGTGVGGLKTLDNTYKGGWALDEDGQARIVTLDLTLNDASSHQWGPAVGICQGAAHCLAASSESACQVDPQCFWVPMAYLEGLVTGNIARSKPQNDQLPYYYPDKSTDMTAVPAFLTQKPLPVSWTDTKPAGQAITASATGAVQTIATDKATLKYTTERQSANAYCCRNSNAQLPADSIRSSCNQVACDQEGGATAAAYPLATDSRTGRFISNICTTSACQPLDGFVQPLQPADPETVLFDSKAVAASQALVQAKCPNIQVDAASLGQTTGQLTQKLRHDCEQASRYYDAMAACAAYQKSGSQDEPNPCNSTQRPTDNVCLGAGPLEQADSCAGQSQEQCTTFPCVWNDEGKSCQTEQCRHATQEQCASASACTMVTPAPGELCRPAQDAADWSLNDDNVWSVTADLKTPTGPLKMAKYRASCNELVGCSTGTDVSAERVASLTCNRYQCEEGKQALMCNTMTAVQKTPQQCESLCSEMEGCTGFLYDEGHCQGVSDSPQYDDNAPVGSMTFYSRAPVTGQLPAGWSHLADLDCLDAQPLLSLPHSTHEERLAVCRSMPACLGFSSPSGQLWSRAQQTGQPPQAQCNLVSAPGNSLFRKDHLCHDGSGGSCTETGTCCNARLQHETHLEKDCHQLLTCTEDGLVAQTTPHPDDTASQDSTVQQACDSGQPALRFYRPSALGTSPLHSPCPMGQFQAAPATPQEAAVCADIFTPNSQKLQLVTPMRQPWNAPLCQSFNATCPRGQTNCTACTAHHCLWTPEAGCRSPLVAVHDAVYGDSIRNDKGYQRNLSCSAYLQTLPQDELATDVQWGTQKGQLQSVQLAETDNFCDQEVQAESFSLKDLHTLYNAEQYTYLNPMFPCARTNGDPNYPVATELASWSDLLPGGLCPFCCTGRDQKQSSEDCPCAVVTHGLLTHQEVPSYPDVALPTSQNETEPATLVRMSEDIDGSCDFSGMTFENLQWGGQSCSSRCDLVGVNKAKGKITAMYERDNDQKLVRKEPLTTPFRGNRFMAAPDVPEANRICRKVSMAALAVTTPPNVKYQSSTNPTQYDIHSKNVGTSKHNAYIWNQADTSDATWDKVWQNTISTANGQWLGESTDPDPTVLLHLGCTPKYDKDDSSCYTHSTWYDCTQHDNCQWKGGCVGSSLSGSDESSQTDANGNILPCGAFFTKDACLAGNAAGGDAAGEDAGGGTGCSWLGPSITYQRALSNNYVHRLAGLPTQCKDPLTQHYDPTTKNYYCQSTCLPQGCQVESAATQSCPLFPDAPHSSCALFGDNCAQDLACSSVQAPEPVCQLLRANEALGQPVDPDPTTNTCPYGYRLATSKAGEKLCFPVRACTEAEVRPVQSHAEGVQQNQACTKSLHTGSDATGGSGNQSGGETHLQPGCDMYEVYLAQVPKVCSEFLHQTACEQYPACTWDSATEEGVCRSKNAWEEFMYASDSQWCPVSFGWNEVTQECTGCQVDTSCLNSATNETDCTKNNPNCAWDGKKCTFAQKYFNMEWTALPEGSTAAPSPVGCTNVTKCKPGEFIIHPATGTSDNICGVIEDDVCVPNFAGMMEGNVRIDEKEQQPTLLCPTLKSKVACEKHSPQCRWAKSDAILAGVSQFDMPRCSVDDIAAKCKTAPPETCTSEEATDKNTTGFDAAYYCGGPLADQSGCHTRDPALVCKTLSTSQSCTFENNTCQTEGPAPSGGETGNNLPLFTWGESRLTSCPPTQVMVRPALVCGNLTQDECRSETYQDRCKVMKDKCVSKYNTAQCYTTKEGADGQSRSTTKEGADGQSRSTTGNSVCPTGPMVSDDSVTGNYYIRNAECAPLRDYCIARQEDQEGDKPYALISRQRQQSFPLKGTGDASQFKTEFPLINCLHNDSSQPDSSAADHVVLAPAYHAVNQGYHYLTTDEFLVDNLKTLSETTQPLMLTKYSNLDFTEDYQLPAGRTFGYGATCGSSVVTDDGRAPEADGQCMHTTPKDRCMYRFQTKEQASAACLHYNGQVEDIRGSLDHLPPLSKPPICKGVVEIADLDRELSTLVDTTNKDRLLRSTYCMNYNTAAPSSSKHAVFQAGDKTYKPIADYFDKRDACQQEQKMVHTGIWCQDGTASPEELPHVPGFAHALTAEEVADVHPFGNNMMPMGQTWVGKHALGMMANDDQNRIHFITRGDCLGQSDMPTFDNKSRSSCNQPSPYRGTPQWAVKSANANSNVAGSSVHTIVNQSCSGLYGCSTTTTKKLMQDYYNCADVWDDHDKVNPDGSSKLFAVNLEVSNRAPTWGGDDGDTGDNSRARAYHGCVDDDCPKNAAFNNDDSTALLSCRANHNAWGDPSKITPDVYSALGQDPLCKGGNLYGGEVAKAGTTDPDSACAAWNVPSPGPFSMKGYAQTTGFDIAFFNVFQRQNKDNQYSSSVDFEQQKLWQHGWGGGEAGSPGRYEKGKDRQDGAWGGKSSRFFGDSNRNTDMTWIAGNQAPALARPQGNLTLGMYGDACNPFLYSLGMGGPTYNMDPDLPQGEWGLPTVPPDMLSPYAWWSGPDDVVREKMWMHLPVYNGAVGSSQRQKRGSVGGNMDANDLIDGVQTGSLGYINSTTFYQTAPDWAVLLELPDEPAPKPVQLAEDPQAQMLGCATVRRSHFMDQDMGKEFKNDMVSGSIGTQPVTGQYAVQWVSSNGVGNDSGKMQDLNLWSAGVGTTSSTTIRNADTAGKFEFVHGKPDDFTPPPHADALDLSAATVGSTGSSATVPYGTDAAQTLPAGHMRAEFCVQGEHTCVPVTVDTTKKETFTLAPAAGGTVPVLPEDKQGFLNYAAPSVAYPGDKVPDNQMYIMPSRGMRQGSAGFTESTQNKYTSSTQFSARDRWESATRVNDPISTMPWFDMSVAVRNAEKNFSKPHWGTTEWNETLVTGAAPYGYLLVTGPEQDTGLEAGMDTTTYAKRYFPSWLPGVCIGQDGSCSTHSTQETCPADTCTWVDYTYMTTPGPTAPYTPVTTPTVDDDPLFWTLNQMKVNQPEAKPIMRSNTQFPTVVTDLCQWPVYDPDNDDVNIPTDGRSAVPLTNRGPFHLNGIPLCATVDVLESQARPAQVRKLPGLYNTPEEGNEACQVGFPDEGAELCSKAQVQQALRTMAPVPASPTKPVWTSGGGHYMFTKAQDNTSWTASDVGAALDDHSIANAAAGAPKQPSQVLPSEVFCCGYTTA